MVRRIVFTLLLGLLSVSPDVAGAQKSCKTGKPCGNSCIAKDKVCRVGTSSGGTSSSQSSPPANAVSPPAGMEFVASSKGTVYYWRGCDGWKGLAASNRIYFKTAEEAVKAGYSPSTQKGCAGPPVPHKRDSLPLAQDECTISRLVDGDTLDCGGSRVRLLLIDTPEMSQVPWGRDALNFLERLLPVGSVARLEYDVQRNDRYGRVLAYVHSLNGTFVNEAMVQAGYAVPLVYPPNVKYVERIRAAAELAKIEKAGLWSSEAFACLPVDSRAGRC
jgi:endonuclease YncB( thermonuclease family)